MSSLVFIDDERLPSEDAVRHYDEVFVVRNHLDFIELMDLIRNITRENLKDFTFTFDHDLQIFESIHSKNEFVQKYGYKDNDKIEVTGKSMLRCLIDCMLDRKIHRKDLPKVEFHTQNPVARDSMKFLWTGLQKHSNNF